jgi:hypothetical protein
MKNKITKILMTVLLIILTATTLYQQSAINKMNTDFSLVRDEVSYGMVGRIVDLATNFEMVLMEQRKEIDRKFEQIRATSELNFETLSFQREDVQTIIDNAIMNIEDRQEMVLMRLEELQEHVWSKHVAYDALLEKTSALENILEDLRNPFLIELGETNINNMPKN